MKFMEKVDVACHRCNRKFGKYKDDEELTYFLCKDCDSVLINEWILLRRGRHKKRDWLG